MAGRTLYEKIWASHTVGILPTGQTQLFIGLHLIHEITTAPAFDMLREKGMDVAFPERTFATVDHIVPTDIRTRPFLDSEAEELTQALEKNVGQFGVEFFGVESPNQGIVHVIEDAKRRLGQSGRLIIRPSGTEPVIRVMGEGDDRELVEQLVDDICAALSAKAAA